MGIVELCLLIAVPVALASLPVVRVVGEPVEAATARGCCYLAYTEEQERFSAGCRCKGTGTMKSLPCSPFSSVLYMERNGDLVLNSCFEKESCCCAWCLHPLIAEGDGLLKEDAAFS